MIGEMVLQAGQFSSHAACLVTVNVLPTLAGSYISLPLVRNKQ